MIYAATLTYVMAILTMLFDKAYLCDTIKGSESSSSAVYISFQGRFQLQIESYHDRRVVSFLQ